MKRIAVEPFNWGKKVEERALAEKRCSTERYRATLKDICVA